MPIYSYIDSSWRTITGVYAYTNNNWRQITTGWAWIDGAWRNFFSSGTFFPLLRSPTTLETLTVRTVGLAVQLYRGSDTAGSYAYQFQYAIGLDAAYTNETGAGSSGTLTGGTTTANYTTDVSYVGALEGISTSSADNSGILNNVDSYRTQEAKRGYIRARVIKSGETQFSNVVRVQKRQPVNISTTISLTRAASLTTYVLTSGNNRSPIPGDTIFWTTNFQNTTTLTNDTRPDYYWFGFVGGTTTNKNSIVSDPANPRNPINARRYIVQNSDIGSTIECVLRAINSNTNTTDLTFTTLVVSDGTLLAPVGLTITYLSGQIRTAWTASVGGNDDFIYYSVSIERDDVVVYTSPTTQLPTFYNYSTAIAGVYKFRVTASQAGSVTVTSAYSGTYTLQAPTAFNVTVQNVTTLDLYKPTVFTINAPTLSTSQLNLWTWTWGVSTITGPEYAKSGSFNTTSVATWDSYIQRPNGTTQTNPSDRTSPTDFWSIQQSGNHTQNVEARNKVKNYVRISWTRPVGTSAVSYSLYVSGYFPGAPTTPDWNKTINVEDVDFVDIEQNYFGGGTNYGNSSSIRLNSIYAFAGAGQTGSSVLGTVGAFNFNGADGTTDWSNCNQVGVRSASKTDNLSLEAPVVGTLTTTGIFEPGQTLSLAEGNGWSPGYASWTKTYNWIKSVTIQPATAGTASTQVIANNNTAVGSEFFCEVVASYKGIVGTIYSSIANIVPGPPSYSITDLFDQRFSISNAAANGGTFYYGTYSGSASGSITETAIAGTYTSPTVSPGTINSTLYSRRYVTQVYPNTVNNIQVNSTRFTTNSVQIALPPQSTGQRRYISNSPSLSAGNTVYISTNGYFGNALMPASNYFLTIPSPGGFLNIAAKDLVLVYCYTLVDSGGVWIRYRGEEYPSGTGRFLEYQVYNTFSGTSYTLFIQNTLSNYVTNTAYTINGSVVNLWSGSQSDTSSLTTNQGTSGWTQRTQTSGTADDGVIQFVIQVPGLPMTSNPTVTRTQGGFTFNITDAATGNFDIFSTYGSSVVSGSATASINGSTGLVTVTGMASDAFATIRISKTRSGYTAPPTIDVQGQALTVVNTFLATPVPSASSNRTDGILISWSAIPNATSYGVWYRGGAPSYDSALDFNAGSSTSYLDTSIGAGVTRQYDVQAYTTTAGFVKSQWGGPATGTRLQVVVATPAITSGPGISWASGNNFTLSATASNATNIEFEVQFGNNNGGPVLSTQTFFMGASAGSRTTGNQQYSWARTRAKANNSTTGLSSSFTGFTGWA